MSGVMSKQIKQEISAMGSGNVQQPQMRQRSGRPPVYRELLQTEMRVHNVKSDPYEFSDDAPMPNFKTLGTVPASSQRTLFELLQPDDANEEGSSSLGPMRTERNPTDLVPNPISQRQSNCMQKKQPKALAKKSTEPKQLGRPRKTTALSGEGASAEEAMRKTIAEYQRLYGPLPTLNVNPGPAPAPAYTPAPILTPIPPAAPNVAPPMTPAPVLPLAMPPPPPPAPQPFFVPVPPHPIPAPMPMDHVSVQYFLNQQKLQQALIQHEMTMNNVIASSFGDFTQRVATLRLLIPPPVFHHQQL